MDKKRHELKPDTPAQKFMPLTFNSMISYLSYLATRGELEEAINVLIRNKHKSEHTS